MEVGKSACLMDPVGERPEMLYACRLQTTGSVIVIFNSGRVMNTILNKNINATHKVLVPCFMKIKKRFHMHKNIISLKFSAQMCLHPC